jgi:hypothetical protein
MMTHYYSFGLKSAHGTGCDCGTPPHKHSPLLKFLTGIPKVILKVEVLLAGAVFETRQRAVSLPAHAQPALESPTAPRPLFSTSGSIQLFTVCSFTPIRTHLTNFRPRRFACLGKA